MAEYGGVMRVATVVDGTGLPCFQEGLAVKDGGVARIEGCVQAAEARGNDPPGLIAVPSVIAQDAHCDAPLDWEPYATMPGWSGVTSVRAGQGGVGLALTPSMQLGMRGVPVNGTAAFEDDRCTDDVRTDALPGKLAPDSEITARERFLFAGRCFFHGRRYED